jgi:hypothetical protein
MVRHFLSHFLNFCYAYAYKSGKSALFKRIFYKGLLISKMDIYKCPKTKKIMLLFFTKKTHILTYKIYMTIMVQKEEFTNFSLFFKNFANLQNAKIQKLQNYKKLQSYKKGNKLIL